MKSIKYISAVVLLCSALLASCSNQEESAYNGGSYIGFATSSTMCPVLEDPEASFDVNIAATEAVSFDRNFAVEVVTAKSSAIDGVHYTIPSYNFTIPAGETKSSVAIKGIWGNFEPTDSVGVQLRLLTPDKYASQLNPETREVAISFLKVCDLDINQFSGYAILSSYFLYEQTHKWERLVKIDVDSTEENTLIARNLFCDGDMYSDNYDVKMHLVTDNPLKPALELVGNPVVYDTRNLFEYKLEDGLLRAQQSIGYTSQYNVCQKFAVLFVDLYVEGETGGMLGAGYMNILEWISDEEAEIIIRDGFDEL